ncbi:glycosyltransferase [Kitasatospora sp. NBC_01287]|uniref:glycosyltransferase n=1 Tax=Kitasatospora sp. NBC_01287 TaxID=2903573 RepID=UPI002254A3B1|nr:glycosyltransferase [Kitasatospora sp. NBC_01287]MCX4748206.1 glycosyltransferase [Kitasatospora sp. NBC_01287]
MSDLSTTLRRARLLADCAALAFDRQAQSTCWPWWYWTRSDHERVVELLRGVPRLTGPLAELARAPQDVAAHRRLNLAVAEVLAERSGPAQELTAALEVIEQSARLGLHLGAEVAGQPAADPMTVERILAGVDRTRPRPGAGPTRVTVVVPFRAGDPHDGRARNLAACLAALADQDLPRDQYRIVVVESDAEPRWRAAFEPHADRYLFAFNPGPFNKSWAVNCGVVHGGGPDGLVCVLDGDVLPDADFLSRGAGRFAQDPTLQVHWPYRDIVFADPASSDRAVALRCAEGRPVVDHAALRGVFLRRPPGGCIWVRRRLFDRIAGLDERFEGWGGEDNDFAWRADFLGGVERFGDTLLHLHHARAHPDPSTPPPTRAPDHHWCSWRPTAPIGDLAKYRAGERPED